MKFCKKHLQIPKGFSASVYRRTENTIDKEKEIRIRTMIENNTTQKKQRLRNMKPNYGFLDLKSTRPSYYLTDYRADQNYDNRYD